MARGPFTAYRPYFRGPRHIFKITMLEYCISSMIVITSLNKIKAPFYSGVGALAGCFSMQQFFIAVFEECTPVTIVIWSVCMCCITIAVHCLKRWFSTSASQINVSWEIIRCAVGNYPVAIIMTQKKKSNLKIFQQTKCSSTSWQKVHN